MRRRTWGLWALAAGLAGTLFLSQGTWIYVKAVAAQVLLERAWDRAQDGEPRAVPWPWADTWPVARLEVPRLGEERIVLAGASGATMAFGPGHLDGSARLGETGNSVLAGHRDTHFRFLERLEDGDEIVVETAAGVRHRYRVVERRVVGERDGSVLEDDKERVLTLITCYPFDAVLAGGPLRYVVRAAIPRPFDDDFASGRRRRVAVPIRSTPESVPRRCSRYGRSARGAPGAPPRSTFPQPAWRTARHIYVGSLLGGPD